VAAGYSKLPLGEKLGIKKGNRIALVNNPESYSRLLGKLPEDVEVASSLEPPLDFIHCFYTERDELEGQFPALKAALSQGGSLWISWPKRASKVRTTLNENVVREIGLKNGLVDIKVCAVDETWSGLKFVRRLRDREV